MSTTPKKDSKHIDPRLLPKRIDKTLDWLEASRDVWKDKCLKAKLELKIKKLSAKRLLEGRDKFKHKLYQAEIVIQQMENERKKHLYEIENLKKDLVLKNSEVESLKKNL